jgi:hypothetical protein
VLCVAQNSIYSLKVGSQKSNYTFSKLITKILFSVLLLRPVHCLDCACDCPNGCRIFNDTYGSVSDGSGSACIKESFGVTGQYGSQ